MKMTEDTRTGWKVFLTIVSIELLILLLIGLEAGKAAPQKFRQFGSWHRSYVTTYSVNEPGSSHSAQGCFEIPLKNWHRTFAARDSQVPCGGRAVFCYHHHCVVGRRTDTSGGGVAYDSLDLNRGLALALHIPSSAIVSADGSYPGGYTWVKWRRVR